MRTMIRPGLTALLLAALAAAPVAAQQDATGTWELTLNSSQGIMMMTVEMEQDGTDVTATADFDMASSIEISNGRHEGGVLSFDIAVDFQGQYLSVTAVARIDGDEMRGSIDVPEAGETVNFTGVRVES